MVSITDYGAFVELEQGVEGLYTCRNVLDQARKTSIEDRQHRRYSRGRRPQCDKEKKRISLGMKQMEPSPWATADERYPVALSRGQGAQSHRLRAFVTLEEGSMGNAHFRLVVESRVRHRRTSSRKARK